MSRSIAVQPPSAARLPVSLLLVAALAAAFPLPLGARSVRGETTPAHLVISEVVTGGGSASDELIELYNPTGDPLPLEGLELVYATASGATVSRRAAWELGAPAVPPGRHLLVANELGAYAPIADVVYASGMASSGGSVALRIQGASTAVDSVGWGSAASVWLEGTPAAAPAAGSSLERLPGGPAGSTRDTDDNAADFVVRTVPDPQNLASPPVPDEAGTSPSPVPTASGSPAPTVEPTTDPTLTPTPSSSPSPGPGAVSIATARAMPEGTSVTIEGTALTASDFTEGGGYVADESGGIAVLLASGTFERGSRLRIAGTLDERFSQRTLRTSNPEMIALGSGTEAAPVSRVTGGVAESVEGSLVLVAGRVAGSPTHLTAGLAFEIDDGSGPVRVLVGPTSGIDTTAWSDGTTIELVGVVGQRDSSGTGSSGYRVQPRDPADVRAVQAPPATPDPSASPGASDPETSPTPPPAGVTRIADARKLPRNARVTVRGTVTMAPGVVDPVSAVIQDESGAILLRLGDEVGPLARGQRVQVAGMRSTLGGMETLRVTTKATRIGDGTEPSPSITRTGAAGEALESRLIRVRGALVAAGRRAGSGSVSFEVDDGSGPLRVFLAAPLDAGTDGLTAGAWVEVTGVLGQETSGAQPLRGYRLWPRNAAEVQVTAPTSTDSTGGAAGEGESGDGAGEAEVGAPTAGLDDLDAPDLGSLSVGATLVHGPWEELDLGGLLWDGSRLVGIDAASGPVAQGLVPLVGAAAAVELHGLSARGREPVTGIPTVALGTGPGDTSLRQAAPDAPSGDMPRAGARWVSVVGRLVGRGTSARLVAEGGSGAIALDRRCADPRDDLPTGIVQVTGIGLAKPSRILLPCDGVRAAPSLAMVALSRAGRGLATEPGDGPVNAGAAPNEVVGTARVAAAVLLAFGALLLGAAAAVRRRLGAGRPPSAEVMEEVGADRSKEDGDGNGSAPRALTLVALPREHESP